MEVEQLKNFIAVAQLGSFQKVAEQKYISQRTVSKQMANLENELGVQLFYRGNNKISLTRAGRYFSQQANDLVNQLNDSILRLQHISNDNTQNLRIGYFSPFEGHLLVQHIHQYKNNPQSRPINFHISEASIEHLLSDVTLGVLDCAYILDYGIHEHLVNSDLDSDVLTSGTMVVGINKDLPLAKRKHLNATNLIGLPILYYSNEDSTYLQTAFLATLPPNHQFDVRRVATIEQMQVLVSLGQAIAFYPAGLSLPTTDEIIYRPLIDGTQNYSIQLVYRSDNNVNGLQAFKNFLLTDMLK